MSVVELPRCRARDLVQAETQLAPGRRTDGHGGPSGTCLPGRASAARLTATGLHPVKDSHHPNVRRSAEPMHRPGGEIVAEVGREIQTLLGSTGRAARGCRADADVQPIPVIAQAVNGFRSAPPTEPDVSNRDWASCEAGAAERRLLLGSATTRECQMGTCKKRLQRDRGPRRTQAPSPFPILFCRHTASAQRPSKCPCLLDECAVGGCRLPHRTRSRIGNRFGNVRGYRQPNSPNKRVSASFRRSRSSARVPAGRGPPDCSSAILPRAATATPTRMPRGAQAGTCGTEQTAANGSRGATSGAGTQPPHPDAGATPEHAAHAVRAVTRAKTGTVVDRSVERSKPAHKRTTSGTRVQRLRLPPRLASLQFLPSSAVGGHMRAVFGA